MSLPEGYWIRGAQLDDASAVASVLLADDVLDVGLSVYDEDFVVGEWSSTGVDPAADAWVALGPEGTIVGSGTLVPVSETVIRSWGVVHPEHRGLGVGSALLDRIGDRTAERLRGVDGARFHHSITDVDEAARAMVLARGFAYVRSFRHMQIDLQGTLDPGDRPRGIEIGAIDPGVDLPRVHAVFVEAFEDEWGYRAPAFDEWLADEVEIPVYDPSLWLLATEGEEAVGALNAIVRGDRGWIGELGVRKDRRERGIATALLRRSFVTFAERGLPRVMLNVDSDNPTGAMTLYEKVGMRAVRGYDVYEVALG